MELYYAGILGYNWRSGTLSPAESGPKFMTTPPKIRRSLAKALFPSLWQNRGLILELTRRELTQRYRGSFLGFLWPVIVPLVMLAVYTFVFGYVFQARWQIGERSSSPTQYALILFAGLTAFNIFSETVNRSTTLIVGMPNYVKKVVFPLEVYPLVVLTNALTLSLINLLLLVVGNLVLAGSFSKTIYLLPLAYLPLIFLCLGLGWFLSSLGVYIRDLAQAMPVITTLLFFLSPIVYQIEAVPERLRQVLYLNPLTTIIDGFRQVLLLGGPLPWLSWGIWTGLTFLLAMLGYSWFMGTKRGFSDVL